MNTVKILIYDIKTEITDGVLCDRLRGRLYMSGIQTHTPSSIKREDGALVVTMGIIGTIVVDAIEACVSRFLNDDNSPEIIFSSGSDVFLT